eukprot:584320-Hanusia_phi.AAC.1
MRCYTLLPSLLLLRRHHHLQHPHPSSVCHSPSSPSSHLPPPWSHKHSSAMCGRISLLARGPGVRISASNLQMPPAGPPPALEVRRAARHGPPPGRPGARGVTDFPRLCASESR